LKEAYKYYLLIKNFNYSIEKYTPKLFIYKSVYKYLVYFEATIICFYNNDFNEGILAFKKLFNCDVNIPLLLCVIIINNIKFYDKYITKDTFTKKEIFNFIKNFTKLDKNMNNIEITMRNINDIINNTLLSKLAN
jgi:uncharacterized membrane protein YhdT